MEDSPRHRTFIISVWIGLIGILMVGLLGIGGLMVYTRLLAPGPPPTLVAMPTATPPPRPSPTAEATATRVVLPPTPAPSPELPAAFWAGPEVIPPGGCTILHWEVHPPAEAFLDGEPVPPAGQREVCPKETRPYELLVPETGQRHTVMVHVEGSPPPPTPTVVPAPRTPTAVATATALPTRRIEVTYPHEMVVGESGKVTVQITLPPELAAHEIGYERAEVVIYPTVPDRPRDTIKDAIQVYPVMWAELVAPNFDITGDDANPRRAVAGMRSCVWTWYLVPRKPGSLQATVKIFTEVSVEKQEATRQLKDYPLRIKVFDRPVAGKIVDYVLGNLFAILGTGGPLGVVLAYLTYRANQENKKLKERIQVLEERIEQRQAEEERV